MNPNIDTSKITLELKHLSYKCVRYYSKDKTPTITDEGLCFWWAHQDLNLGPKDYESSALTN